MIKRTLAIGLGRVKTHWIQGEYVDGNWVCAVGALGKRNEREWFDSRDEVYMRLLMELPEEFTGQPVENFNDNVHTTQEDVIALYERAIATIEEEIEALKVPKVVEDPPVLITLPPAKVKVKEVI